MGLLKLMIMIDAFDNGMIDLIDNRKKKKDALVIDMFERVSKRMKKENTELIKELRKMKKNDGNVVMSSDEEKKVKKERVKQLNKAMMKLKNYQKNNMHTDLIERLTSDGDDLMSTSSNTEPIKSQEVLDLIVDEMELLADDE